MYLHTGSITSSDWKEIHANTFNHCKGTAGLGICIVLCVGSRDIRTRGGKGGGEDKDIQTYL